MDWNAHFAKAKKLSTLERMLMSKVEEMGIRYDPSKESLRVIANFYKKLRPTAYDMLIAAYKREQELEASPASRSSSTQSTKATTRATAKTVGIQKGLEAEIEAWMARHKPANT